MNDPTPYTEDDVSDVAHILAPAVEALHAAAGRLVAEHKAEVERLTAELDDSRAEVGHLLFDCDKARADVRHRNRRLMEVARERDGFKRNLAAALEENERLTAALDQAQLNSIEARNPGIDMDEVRLARQGTSAGDASPTGVSSSRWEVDEFEQNVASNGEQKVRCYRARGTEVDVDLADRVVNLLNADNWEVYDAPAGECAGDASPTGVPLPSGGAALVAIMGALQPLADDLALRVLDTARARVVNLTPENLGEEPSDESKKDDGNAEPLCRGRLHGVERDEGNLRNLVTIETTDYIAMDHFLGKVAVYPADATPAPRAVTADDMAAVDQSPQKWSYQDQANALNKRIGAHPLPTRGQVYEALRKATSSTSWPGLEAQANAVMALLTQPTREGEKPGRAKVRQTIALLLPMTVPVRSGDVDAITDAVMALYERRGSE